MSTNILHMPAAMTEAVDNQGRITPVFAKFIRELVIQANAECAPGRIAGFYLSAADVANAEKFNQAGATAGLGVGRYLGWALCNGNNGTPSLNAKFLRWSTSAEGSAGGSDTHSHSAGTLHAHIGLSDGEVRLESYSATYTYGQYSTLAGPSLISATDDDSTKVSGITASASTLPAHYHLVPLMRV
jgi:hypothetical protein